jgi:hypothetical protein
MAKNNRTIGGVKRMFMGLLKSSKKIIFAKNIWIQVKEHNLIMVQFIKIL